MLRSILVPLDGSSFGERSLPLASRIAKASGASLHLAHVHVPHEPEHLLSNTSFHWEGVDVGEYDDRQRRREEEYLADLEERLQGNGASVDRTVLEGELVAEELVAYASRVETDMIFITSHAYSGVKRARWGSIADGMLHRTGVPMVVVHPARGESTPEPVTDIEHILVPLDGSALAEAVLGPATDLAKATGARLTLARILPPANVLGPRVLPIVADREEDVVAHAQEYLEGVAARLSRDGLDVEVHASVGSTPARAIADVAEDRGADLIALATHGYGGLKRTVLGSVADKLLRSSRLPLLLMRPLAEA